MKIEFRIKCTTANNWYMHKRGQVMELGWGSNKEGGGGLYMQNLLSKGKGIKYIKIRNSEM